MVRAPATADADRPIVIAHRGASGYLPEHTLAAKALAHAMGADYLEQDVVATRDGQLIVFHDLWLNDLTDVAARFPGRSRPDGLHYCADFDLAEIRTLSLTERRVRGRRHPKYPGRFPPEAGAFRIPTLEEELRFIAGLNRSTGRAVGIYAEIKAPAWHSAQGLDVADGLLRTLHDAGYRGGDNRAYIQCFDAAELRRLHALDLSMPLIQLLDREGDMPDRQALESVASYADGIGPPLEWVLGNREPDARSLVAMAHDAGLCVHPYTVRADALPAGVESLEALLTTLVEVHRVDGLFTDFPDEVILHLARLGW